MDMIDILGGLLGGKSGGAGSGPDIFKDILNRSRRSAPGSQAESVPGPPSENQLDRAARELEDLLNVANERGAARGADRPQPRQQIPVPAPADANSPRGDSYSRSRDDRTAAYPPTEQMPQNDQAVVLVRAMLNAAKADGRISPDEQRNILSQFGNGQADVVQFLRDELATPLDVREFAWSVPIGMEAQVYGMSLLAIAVDSNAETKYLSELAHALRLSTAVREQLHQRYGATPVR